MKEKTLDVLEYNKIIRLLTEQAGSAMTRGILSELKPFSDVKQIRSPHVYGIRRAYSYSQQAFVPFPLEVSPLDQITCIVRR